MQPQTQIAVAGAGLIGKAHIAAIQSNPALSLCAVIEPAPLHGRFPDVPHYPSLEALFAAQRPDGVVLATPNALHATHARACIDRNIPCLLEKPLTPTIEEGQALVDYIVQKQATVLIGHHRAHSPIMARACETVASGALGRIVGVMGSALFYKPDHYFAEGPWRTQPGGGPLLLNMIHEVHNLRMLCGEIAAVQAIKSHAVRQFAVEDTVAIALEFESGALGTFLLSDTAASARSWEQTSQENTAYPSYRDEDCYVIAGTQGTLAVPTMRMKAFASGETPSWWKPFQESTISLEREDPIARQMAHFGAVCRGEARPKVSAHDGLTNLKVINAIVRASQSGQRFEII
jgi:predicted dehydrogenase